MVDETPPPDRQLKPVAALLLLFIHFATFLSVIMLGEWISGGDTVGVMFLIGAALIGPLIALYVGLVRYAPLEPTLAALRLTMPRAREVWITLLAVLAAVALAPVAADVTARVIALFPLDKGLNEVIVGDSADVERLMMVAQIFLSPLVDELLFRGFLQPRLQKSVGRWRAFIVVLALYSVAQINPRFIPAALILGLPLGLITLMVESTWVLIIAHIAHEATPQVLWWIFGSPNAAAPSDDAVTFVPWWFSAICVAVAVLAVAGAWLIWRRGRRLPT